METADLLARTAADQQLSISEHAAKLLAAALGRSRCRMTSDPAELAHGGLFDSAAVRKARGAFFTPASLCEYIVRWAVRGGRDRVLEPSCGEAAFLTAAARHLNQLGAVPEPGQLAGVELHAASSATAQALVAELGWPAEVTTADFFTVPPSRTFEAVIGNPPYVRYQDFSGPARVRARAAALAAGVTLTALASSWAAFTVHAASVLEARWSSRPRFAG